MHYKHIIEKQRQFFANDGTLDLNFRREVLTKFGRIVEANSERIQEAVYKDIKRPHALVKGTEVDPVIEDVKYFLDQLEKWSAPEDKGETPFGHAYVYKDPLGLVLVIAPFNFPFQLGIRPVVAALACGNTVVLKPSEYASHTASLVAELIGQNFDEQVISVVQGAGDVAAALLEERWDHIYYTGGTRIGRIVMRAAAEHLTSVTLELGGKGPSYIDVDADLQKAASKIVPMKLLNCGQICITTDYVLVHEKVREQFLQTLVATYKAILSDNKAKETPLHSRLINAGHWHRIDNLVKQTKGKLVFTTGEPSDKDDLFIAPYVFEVEKEDILMEDEIFGPILPILTVNSTEDAIKFIRAGEKPLSAYIFTENKDTAELFLRRVHSGNAMVNDVINNFNVMELPFGGVGYSGLGRTHGKYDLEAFTHEKAVVKAP